MNCQIRAEWSEEMGKLLNFIGRIALAVLIVLLIGYGWAFLEIKILLKSNPELFGLVFYHQADSTMAASFSEDDIVIVQKNSNYITGDRIMYMTEDNSYYIRTVHKIEANSVILSCDSCR